MRGLVTHYTLFVIHHATRAVRIVGTTVNPGELFMDQVAKLLTDPVDGFLRHARFLIIDRDSKFTAKFRSVLKDAGVRVAAHPRVGSELQRLRREIREVHQGRVPRPDDLLRDRRRSLRALAESTRLITSRNETTRGSVTSSSIPVLGDAEGIVRTPRAPRRAALELLLPLRGLTARSTLELRRRHDHVTGGATRYAHSRLRCNPAHGSGSRINLFRRRRVPQEPEAKCPPLLCPAAPVSKRKPCRSSKGDKISTPARRHSVASLICGGRSLHRYMR